MSDRGPALENAYACIAELWCSPQDVDMVDVRQRASGVVEALQGMDPESAALLARFLDSAITEEEYIELFELDPKCSLYLGSHVFEEPKTCAQAGLSDRNGYMIELLGIYRHLGLSPAQRELPDYLPLMVEFLGLSAKSGDAVRGKLVQEYMLPHLPPIRARLEQLKTSYVCLLDALERVLRLEFNQPQGV